MNSPIPSSFPLAKSGNEKLFTTYPELVAPAGKFLAAVEKVFPEPEVRRIKEAMETMMLLHADQGRRPGGDLYLTHILAVTTRVVNHVPAVDSDVVIASLFHDTVEDVTQNLAELGDMDETRTVEEVALEVLRQQYGDRVSRIVRAVTNPDFKGILAAKGIYRGDPQYLPAKNVLYFHHVREAIKDPDALAVKIADLAENAASLNAIPYQTEDRVKLQKYLAAKYLPVVVHAIELLHSLDRYPDYKQEFQQTMISLKKILG